MIDTPKENYSSKKRGRTRQPRLSKELDKVNVIPRNAVNQSPLHSVTTNNKTTTTTTSVILSQYDLI
ncbi:hypothetical protein WUBG_05254 [Wuchereria bancrofti]|uniref:Uncharacterized protein n=1 Tax=Wuchereria bancrofti TaxID=6293 RepID=J9B9R5_WUCBA|nr:hypothetical protein WUBG_05254 [Wuchereria bancrofti]